MTEPPIRLQADGERLTGTSLKTPKAAAIAGIIFSVLLIAIFWLLRAAFPSQPIPASTVLCDQAATIAVAVNLIPFAGVAFLWFIGVVRDRLGEREDRLFGTVYFGSGLLFLAMLFSAAAVVSSTTIAFAARPGQATDPDTFVFVRTLASDLTNTYALKMAAVFMLSTSSVAARTKFVPRYLAVLGMVLGLFILFGSQYLDWSFFVFPVWVLLLSIQILIDNFRRTSLAPDRS